MRVALVAIGSRGDVQPFLALGSALRDRGHEVRLATHADFRALTAEAGLEYAPMPGSPAHYFGSPKLIASLRSSRSPWQLVRRMPRQDAATAGEATAVIAEYVRRATDKADLLVTSPFVRNAFLGRQPDLPWAFVSWYPTLPTSAFPAMSVPRLPLGGGYNRLSHHVSRYLEWRLCRPIVNAYRAKLGRPPLGARVPFAELERGRPNFCLQSPRVLPRPDDWPDNVHLDGYWFWDRDWTPTPEAVTAVDRDPAPVVVSFGSLWPAYPDHALRTVVSAAEALGHRVIVIDGPEGAEMPDGVVRLHDVDYTWLFPRAAVVVHHGGFGTGAAALRAGAPQVVAPIFVDHPFWAERMRAIGVAPEAVPGAQLDPVLLRRALTRALRDPELRRHAARVGAAVRAESAVDKACAVLERWIGVEEWARRPH